MLATGFRLQYRVAMRITPKHSLPVAALPSAAPPATSLATQLASSPALSSAAGLAAVVAALLGLAPATALGQADAVVRAEAIPESVLRPYSVRQAREAASALPLPEPAEIETIDDGRAPRDYEWMKGSVQVIEQPRDPVTGAYRRPKIIVGLPSDTMKSWLKASGITAERCLLPMVRARAKLNEEGEASGALWLYARCTFQ